ncbi:MAG TPA: N-acetylmuramic acid 6-phosphate etherase [Balneolaceae bacterium]|nr:N-acetylmuramic acid 6-phosphate etherase [Balneolaceae bacterium]
MKDKHSLFRQLGTLLTEQRNPASQNIDVADASEIVRIINEEDKKVAFAVEKRLDVIARGVEMIAGALKAGGRLFYFGAGTSGRLGILDASECPPTFGTDPETAQAFIAGGRDAIFIAQEGAEDLEDTGASEAEEAGVGPADVVVGLAASGRTPYVHGALKYADRAGAATILLTTVTGEQVQLQPDLIIDVPVGPEVIMGSTRMKSATAQKMVLNMLSTGAMIRLGKVFENVMVDLKLTNRKLEERAKRIIMMFSGLEYDEAEEMLENADNHVKTALIMALGNLNKTEALQKLSEHDGMVRLVLQDLE